MNLFLYVYTLYRYRDRYDIHTDMCIVDVHTGSCDRICDDILTIALWS